MEIKKGMLIMSNQEQLNDALGISIERFMEIQGRAKLFMVLEGSISKGIERMIENEGSLSVNEFFAMAYVAGIEITSKTMSDSPFMAMLAEKALVMNMGLQAHQLGLYDELMAIVRKHETYNEIDELLNKIADQARDEFKND